MTNSLDVDEDPNFTNRWRCSFPKQLLNAHQIPSSITFSICRGDCEAVYKTVDTESLTGLTTITCPIIRHRLEFRENLQSVLLCSKAGSVLKNLHINDDSRWFTFVFPVIVRREIN